MISNSQRLAGVLMLVGLSGMVWAQSAPDSFATGTSTPIATNIDGVPGLGATGNYPASSAYNLRFGQGPAPANARVDGFTFGGDTFTRVFPAIGTPFDRVLVKRVNNPQVNFEKVTAFFCTPSTPPNPAPNGSELFYGCDYVDTMEGLINSFILNRGSDNLFANRSQDTTVNNIERVDMILDSGLGSVDTVRTGFLLMERGGNDDFKMAAITSLDDDGEVATLGPLITGTAGTAWGNSGLNILSTVFQSVETGALPFRPSQNISSQAIHGTYISFADLGIPSGDPIFGVALFPGDVTEAMDLIGLTDVPLDTSGASNTTGGLDFMAGGGFFTAEGTPDPVANIVDLTAGCGLGSNNSPITVDSTVRNSGVVTFD
ncbi:MAG: hypothetical protein LC637_13310, partial [Xanthomonadaceae bacterium]|nr:hypothetical protein [Xanthomonadaceae bacterium]